jgi:hypothetical protein
MRLKNMKLIGSKVLLVAPQTLIEIELGSKTSSHQDTCRIGSIARLAVDNKDATDRYMGTRAG